MTEEDLECYRAGRYDDQCRWYDAKAGFNKRWYYCFQTSTVVLSAMTTLIVAAGVYFEDTRWVRLAALVTATAVTVAASLLKIYRFQEQWLDYRSTAETLKKERYLLEARIDEYATTDSPGQLFVNRVENLISRQNTLWVGRSPKDAG